MQKKWGKGLLCLLAFILAGTFYCLNARMQEKPAWVADVPEQDAAEAASGIAAETQEGQREYETETKRIYVHICGEVRQPGVYEVAEGSRIYELLALSGGATEKGQPDAVNLADVLRDGDRIVIPSKEEAAVTAAAEQGGSDGLVNINTASMEQLMTLPGIGEAKASDIIQYREKNGGFEEISDIMKISGIKEALFEKIQDRITV